MHHQNQFLFITTSRILVQESKKKNNNFNAFEHALSSLRNKIIIVTVVYERRSNINNLFIF